MEFDEDDAITAIREALPAESNTRYSDDQLINIVDMIWDFYEENDLLEIDCDEDPLEDDSIFDDLVTYVRRMLKKDKGATIDPADVETIVKAELDYEESLDADL